MSGKTLSTLYRRFFQSGLWVLLFTPVLFFVIYGCAHHQTYPWVIEVEAYDLNPAARNLPKVPPDQIIVYPEKRFAPKAYFLVARLRSGQSSDFLPKEDLINEFKKKAGDLGADEVVVLDMFQAGNEGQGKTEQKPNNLGLEDSKFIAKTGSQPSNDLGYIQAPHDTAITVLEPRPVETPKTIKALLYRGEALAIRTKP